MVLRLSVGLSVLALLVLGGLQYHWIGQIAVAERQRLERNVAESSREFADDFFAEFRNFGNALEPRFGPMSSDPSLIAARYHEWMLNAPYPNLVSALYIVRTPGEVLRMNSTTGAFEQESFGTSAQLLDPKRTDTSAIVFSFNRRFPGPRGQEGPGAPPREANPFERDFPEGSIVAELNHDVVVNQIFPRLVARRFTDYEGRDYRVAVTASQPEIAPRVVFTSDDMWTEKDVASPDFSMDLLGPPTPAQRRGGGGPGPAQGPRGGRGERGRGPDPRGPMMTMVGQNWRLLVKHRAGSVQTAVTEFRARNLAISFGVLVVLGISAIAIVISSGRARRLGKLQMEFAAGISHELRTPLAVIQSAAHNLGAGVVKDREGIEEYAGIVKSEARRLTDMVEQVMAYTETQSGRKRYTLAPVDIGEVVEAAISHIGNVLRDGSATVETNIEADLPPVMADASALTRSLQNLLSNAVKYGQRDGLAKIEVHARRVSESGTPGKVELSVIDHGPGVPLADVRSLFEAFHRGSNAKTNTPGNGLGLHLVERMMNAQNGSVTYEPAPDGGAKFTLIISAAGS